MSTTHTFTTEELRKLLLATVRRARNAVRLDDFLRGTDDEVADEMLERTCPGASRPSQHSHDGWWNDDY